MVLHQSRVPDRPIRARRRRHAYAPPRLLHDDSEDKAVVHLGRRGNALNGGFDVGDLGWRVVGTPVIVSTSLVHQSRVGTEHVVEVDPLRESGPAGGAVAGVQCIGVGASAVAVVVVYWGSDGAGGHASGGAADGSGDVDGLAWFIVSWVQGVGQGIGKSGEGRGKQEEVDHVEGLGCRLRADLKSVEKRKKSERLELALAFPC